MAGPWKTLWIPRRDRPGVWKPRKAVENSGWFSGKPGGKVRALPREVFHCLKKWICAKPVLPAGDVENLPEKGSRTGADQLSRMFFTISSTVSLKWVSSFMRLST